MNLGVQHQAKWFIHQSQVNMTTLDVSISKPVFTNKYLILTLHNHVIQHDKLITEYPLIIAYAPYTVAKQIMSYFN